VTEILPCVEVGPETEAETAVVWLHGLGASGHDFEDVAPLLQLPTTRFVFPHAPKRAVTINTGLIMPAWYDIRFLGHGSGGEEPRHVHESAELVTALLDREVERGVPSDRIVLAGFSQGAAMALHVGLRYTQALAGIVVLSGYELLPDTREFEASPINAATPILFCHGSLDPLVPVERGRLAHDAVAAGGRSVEWHEFPHDHTVSLEEIEVVRVFLHQQLAAGLKA
jgi:phospholipase/carboxylesterase